MMFLTSHTRASKDVTITRNYLAEVVVISNPCMKEFIITTTTARAWMLLIQKLHSSKTEQRHLTPKHFQIQENSEGEFKATSTHSCTLRSKISFLIHHALPNIRFNSRSRRIREALIKIPSRINFPVKVTLFNQIKHLWKSPSAPQLSSFQQ